MPLLRSQYYALHEHPSEGAKGAPTFIRSGNACYDMGLVPFHKPKARPPPDATAGETDVINFHGRFVWYELITTEAEAAKAFYGKVMGWGIGRIRCLPLETIW